MINLISEIGSNHNNDLKRIELLLNESRKCGFNAVKFQLFKGELLTKNKDMQSEYKKNELDLNLLPRISNMCHGLNMAFGITPFYIDAIDQSIAYVDFYKISSFDISRLDLIENCILSEKNLYISLGLATDEDINNLLNLIREKKFHGQQITLLHCISKYPASYKDFCPHRINDIWQKIVESKLDNLLFGYSDHTKDSDVIGEAIRMGCTALELHFDLDDLKGAESKYNHCWSPESLNAFYDRMLKFNDMRISKFILTEDDLKQKAHPITGFRDN